MDVGVIVYDYMDTFFCCKVEKDIFHSSCLDVSRLRKLTAFH